MDQKNTGYIPFNSEKKQPLVFSKHEETLNIFPPTADIPQPVIPVFHAVQANV